VKATDDLLTKLKDISRRLSDLAGNPGQHELDPDAVVDLNLAREPVDKLIRRVEQIKQ
jgi:hypothetical protein